MSILHDTLSVLPFVNVVQILFQQDLRSDSSQPVVDINVVPVLLGLQITGKGVNITVPDDGLEWTNADIRPRFVSVQRTCYVREFTTF